MEKLSRVKKYEELRKSIELDNNIDQTEHDGSIVNTEDVLKSFDSSIFKKAEVQQETMEPKRAKLEHKQDDVMESKDTLSDTFTNEYLDDFIKEVRDYNIRKGNRESENTEVDILYQLNAVNRAKRTQYVQEIKEEAPIITKDRTVLSKDDIAKEVQNLLLEEADLEHIKEEPEPVYEDMILSPFGLTEVTPAEETIEELASVEVKETETMQEEETVENASIVEEKEEIPASEEVQVKKVILPDYADIDDTCEQSVVPKDTLHKKLMEETQQLRVQLDEYEEELTDLSSGVEKNNKLLNFVLCFLILVLLVVIGFIVYTLWKAGGISI